MDESLSLSLSPPPLPAPAASSHTEEERMREELSSYLLALKTSTSVTLPPDFDYLADSSLSSPISPAPPSPTSPTSLPLDPLPAESASSAGLEQESAAAFPPLSHLQHSASPPLPLPFPAPTSSADDLSRVVEAAPAVVERDVDTLMGEVEAMSAALQWDEAAEMRKIAELDALIERLTLSAQPSDLPAPAQPSLLSDAALFTSHAGGADPSDDEDEQQTTFLTAISTREVRPSYTSPEEEKEQLTLPSELPSWAEERVEDEEGGVVGEVPQLTMSAGEGFTLTSHEVQKLDDIDTLISALRADEKAGKKRRFVSRHTPAVPSHPSHSPTGSTQSVRKAGKQGPRQNKARGSDKAANAKLPSIAVPQPHVLSAPIPGLSPQETAGAYVDSLSQLLDDCLSRGERERLGEIEARLALSSEAGLDPIIACETGEAEEREGKVGGRRVRFEAFDAEAYLKSIHPHPTPAYSSLRQLYGKEGEEQKTAPTQDGEEDGFEWMDAGLDAESDDTRLLDERDDAEAILPDSDDDSHPASLDRLRTLTTAPDPDLDTKDDGDDAAHAAESSLDERMQATQAGNDAARKRVQRLIREAEERRRRLGRVEPTGRTDDRRVHTSDDRRPRASPHLVPLDRRPASAEAVGAANSGHRSP